MHHDLQIQRVADGVHVDRRSVRRCAPDAVVIGGPYNLAFVAAVSATLGVDVGNVNHFRYRRTGTRS